MVEMIDLNIYGKAGILDEYSFPFSTFHSTLQELNAPTKNPKGYILY